jgi:mono/diheme cytochrome c family protein
METLSMKLGRFLTVCLCLQIFACTKKKPEPVSTEASNPVPAQDSASPDPLEQQKIMTNPVHLGIPLVPDSATGDTRNVFKLSEREKVQLASLEAERPSYESYKTNLAAGRKVYEKHCVSCHGAEGKGGGPVADSLPIAPTNFHEWPIKYGTNLGELALSIAYGRGEGSMPGFAGTLSKEDFWAVSHLIASWVHARADVKN